MKMKTLKRLRTIPFFIFLLMGLIIPAQTVTRKPLNFEVTLRNIHSWRGLIFSDSPTTTVELSYKIKESGFKAGVWGGYSLDGDYTDINYYLEYVHSGWTFAYILDPSSYDIFDSHTDYFSCINISYTLQNKRFPVKMLLSPIISERYDNYIEKRDRKKKKRYSTYAEVSMPFLIQGYQILTLGIGGSFALADCKSNYYGNHVANWANIFIKYDNYIKLLQHKIPLSIQTLWNPESHKVAFQISFQLL